MNKKNTIKKVVFSVLYPLIVTGAVFLVWFLASLYYDSALILPSPGETVKRLFELFATSKFWGAFGMTLFRSVLSFLLCFVLAAGLATLSRLFLVAKRLITPLISILRALPTVAVVLLFVIWFSPSFAAVSVSLLVVMPTLYASLYNAMLNLDPEIFELCKVYAVKKSRVLWRFVLPQLVPDIVLAVAAGLSLNLKLMIAAEVLANVFPSLGSMMSTANAFFRTADVLALTLAAVLTAAALEFGVKKAFLPLIKWKEYGDAL